MAVDAIGLTGTTDTSLPKNAAVTQEAFLKILLTQLRFQDPLKPVDNQQFLAQLAQFSAIEINREQSEKVDTLLQMNSTAQAVGLLGQQVEVQGTSGAGVGEVTAVSFRTGQPALTVKTTSATLVDVKLQDVTLVQEKN